MKVGDRIDNQIIIDIKDGKPVYMHIDEFDRRDRLGIVIWGN